MKRILTSLAGVLVIGLVFGFWAQSYGMPRIGLHAMTFGQYLVFYLIVVTGALLIGVVKGLGGLTDRGAR